MTQSYNFSISTAALDYSLDKNGVYNSSQLYLNMLLKLDLSSKHMLYDSSDIVNYKVCINGVHRIKIYIYANVLIHLPNKTIRSSEDWSWLDSSSDVSGKR